ncbi:hypothetical protein [Rhizobium sp. LjRoot254]|uniref:hypothetical protein n=1 Tax=Rhizobium sp. LjRoot254 TaxID=3342297 RepID=UPI003ED054EB
MTQLKQYSLHARLGEKAPQGSVYKYGELPAFGVPVPNKLLRLFGDDRDVFLKGRQCENQGLGIGAFAYYRRVVENHKNDIFDRIIKVCQTVEPQTKLIAELHAAKKEVSFFKAIEQIKTALPQGLLINGNNPLTILHSALSVGLHNESDDECLRPAHAVRLILTDLVQKMAILRQDGTDLRNAVSLLLNKQASKAGPSDPAS